MKGDLVILNLTYLPSQVWGSEQLPYLKKGLNDLDTAMHILQTKRVATVNI